MKIIEQHISFASEELVLTNQRALYWPKMSVLIIADLHLGKAAHFRRNGIQVPTSVALKDLERLAQLTQFYQPDDLWILGDFLHAGSNLEVQLFKEFVIKFPSTKFHLVRGNHDVIDDFELLSLGFDSVVTQANIRKVNLSHESDTSITERYSISGHIHPGVRIKTNTRGSVKLPCYAFVGNQIILPAFSEFTGLDTSIAIPGGKYYAFYKDGFLVL